jgi:1-acyl-sn-glycerol-3-phosphate acyltransferase
MTYSRGAMWSDPDDLPQQVVESLAADLGTTGSPRSDLTLGDLGLDSLACAELALAVEERFGIRLGEADVTSRSTFEEVVRAVEAGPRGGRRLPATVGTLQPSVKLAFGGAFARLHRLEIHGRDHVPESGPAVMAANHRSNWDVPLHVVASPRPITFIAKRELFRGPATLFFQSLGGFSLRREVADLRAIDRALAVLERGELLGIYPEGRRNKLGPEMLPFLQGAAWLALRTGAPLVPAGITGTGPAGRATNGEPRRVHVRFGSAIGVEREDDPILRRKKAEALTAEVRQAISELTATP